MKFIFVVLFLITSIQIQAETHFVDKNKFTQFLDELKSGMSLPIDKFDRETGVRTIGFTTHGQIEYGEGTKYGIEYQLLASGPYNPDNKMAFDITEVRVSRMEITYCNFLYALDEDYRFKKLTLILDTEANVKRLDEYILQYTPESNDRDCQTTGKAAPHISSNIRLSERTKSQFQTIIGQWIGDRLK